MRHIVNFGLLFTFITLAVSGVLAFTAPFSIVNTRIHIVAGAATVILVGLHLVDRTTYFKRHLFGPSGSARLSRIALISITLLWSLVLAAAYSNWFPVRQIMEQGYEARQRSTIVRSSPLIGFEEADAVRLVARQGSAKADASVDLLIKYGPAFQASAPPSIAVWAETTTGSMIETLYVDERLAHSETPTWAGKQIPRHRVLPIWRHRYTLVSGVDPYGEVDAFTSATPTHSFTLENYLKLGQQKEFVLWVEVNAPQDPNRVFTDPLIGQPSTLYSAMITLDAPQPYTILELTGYSDPESRGELLYDLERITTAKDLIDLLLVRVTPKPGLMATPAPAP
jgi:hypothetical protein